MNRRSFLTTLASVPLLGRLAPKSVPTIFGDWSDESEIVNVISYDYANGPDHTGWIRVVGHPVKQVHAVFVGDTQIQCECGKCERIPWAVQNATFDSTGRLVDS